MDKISVSKIQYVLNFVIINRKNKKYLRSYNSSTPENICSKTMKDSKDIVQEKIEGIKSKKL